MVYLSEDSHPSKYKLGLVYGNYVNVAHYNKTEMHTWSVKNFCC